MISFSIYSGESVSVSDITEKRVDGFSWNFQERSNMRQWTILIYIFSGSILTNNITEKLVNGFQWHFQDMLDTEQQNNWLDCHAQIDWCLVPKICAVSCLWTTVWEKWLMDFVKLAGCHTRNNLEHLGNPAFHSFETAFSLPSVSVFVRNIMEGINGCSQNIQDLLDMTKEKIVRLLHAWLDCFTLLKVCGGFALSECFLLLDVLLSYSRSFCK